MPANDFSPEDQAGLAAMSEQEVFDLCRAEDEVVSNVGLTFISNLDALRPDTIATAKWERKRVEAAYLKKKAAEAERLRLEQEEAQKRIREQEAKKLKAQQEQKKKELEKRLREEEEQRKKMQGGLEIILSSLTNDTSKESICIQGMELTSIKVRLISKALEKNTSCRCLDLSRRSLSDTDGVAMANMLKHNVGLEVLILEGNQLGVKSAKAFAEALEVNESLRTLNLESNNLTMSGNDQTGVIALSKAFEKNGYLLVLNLCGNKITSESTEHWCASLDKNESLTMLDVSGNDVPVGHARKIETVIAVNRHNLQVLRDREKKERREMYENEFQTRIWNMEVEARRLEIEAIEERRMKRMEDAMDEWALDFEKQKDRQAEQCAEIEQAYLERKAANKKKKKK